MPRSTKPRDVAPTLAETLEKEYPTYLGKKARWFVPELSPEEAITMLQVVVDQMNASVKGLKGSAISPEVGRLNQLLCKMKGSVPKMKTTKR